MAYTRRVYLGDVNAATPTWYDISQWTDAWEGEFTERADGGPATSRFLVRQKGQDGTLLPVAPTVGMEICYFLEHDSNPLLHKYKFGGTIAIPPAEPDAVNALRHMYALECIDFTEELYQMVPYISFVAPDQLTDVDRVWHLMNGAFPTKWDFTSQLAGFPDLGEVPFPTGEVQGFYREPVIDIINHLASDVGRVGDPGYPVPWRRWHISVEWQNPATPGQGAPDDSYALMRVLHYYPGDALPLSAVKLKDVPDGSHAVYGPDYEIVPNGSQLFNIMSIAGPDADPSGVQWQNEVGATARAGDITKTTPSNPEAWDAGAGSTQKITEDGGRVTMAMEESLLGADSFDGPPLPEGNRTAEVGGTWQLGGPNADDSWIATANGTAYAASLIEPPNNRKVWWLLDTKASNCIVQIHYPVNPFGARLCFRGLDGANLWSIENNTTRYVLKLRTTAGGEVVVHNYTTSEVPADGDVLKVSLEGDDIHFYLGRAGGEPAFIETVNDSNLNYATKHGFGMNLVSGVGVARADDFRCWHIYSKRAFGLGTTPDAEDVADIEYAWLFDENRDAQVAESGTPIGSPISYTYGDQYEVEARREPHARGEGDMVVKYYRTPAGGSRTLVHTSTVIPDPTEATPLYVNAAFFHNGSSLTNVLFRRFTFSTHIDPTSIAAYGPHERKGVLKDTTLDNWTRREERAQAIFQRYAYPRVTMTCTSQTQYDAGTRVLVSNGALDPPWVDHQLIVRKVTPNYRATGNKQEPVYHYELGDTLREYGDNEPIGVLLRGPRRIEAPDVPTGLTIGVGQRDGPNSVRQTVSLDPVDANVRYVQLQVVRPDDSVGGQRPIETYPPDVTDYQIPGLAPQQSAQVKARTVDQNGVPSDWTAVKTFTTVEIDDTPQAFQTETHETSFVDGAGLKRLTASYDSGDDALTFSTNAIPTEANKVIFRAQNAGAYIQFAEGSVAVGSTALATSATRGFIYIPGGAGAPTGTPEVIDDTVPLYIDTSTGTLYWYDFAGVDDWVAIAGGGGGGGSVLLEWTYDAGSTDIPLEDWIAQECKITGNVTQITVFSPQTGSIDFELSKATYAALPTFTSMNASAHVTISSANKTQVTSFGSWTTTSITAEDWLKIKVNSISGFDELTISVLVEP